MPGVDQHDKYIHNGNAPPIGGETYTDEPDNNCGVTPQIIHHTERPTWPSHPADDQPTQHH